LFGEFQSFHQLMLMTQY